MNAAGVVFASQVIDQVRPLLEGAREHTERAVKSTTWRDLGHDHVALATDFDAEHAEPALFVVEDVVLDETDHNL